MANKYYAVKQGYKIGIYNTWDDCKKQVEGYSGAVYKGFPTLEKAEEFLGLSSDSEKKPAENTISEAEAIAYVDGSYDDSLKEFSYGVIILYDEIEEHYSEKFNTPSLVSMRNVAGEIKGAERAMQFCIDKGISSIDIYYDYEGIKKWCTGEWKATKVGTKAYKDFYDNIKNKVKVRFFKVEAHSGDEYNDLADKLAKSALGIGNCPLIIQKENNMTANNIKYDELVAIIDLLKEDNEGLVVEECSVPYGKGFNLSLDIPNKQNLKVICFSEKNKIWVQGKKEDLFNQFSLYIVELLETDEVPKFLNTVHNLKIDKDVIDLEFDVFFPNAKGRLPSKVNNYLHQAVYNLKINGDMYNATFLAEPAIRSLEAVLKIALQDHNLPIREEDKNYDSFFVFGKQNKRYILKQEYIKPEHSNDFVEYIGNCYNHFSIHRNTLDHWDNPKCDFDTTRIIKTTTEAHTLIKDTIKIIDGYFKL